jgi:hypothetical protein
MRKGLKPGDQVIYRKQKHSTHPGRRAADVDPAPHGDDYAYQVDKFWTVIAVEPGGEVLVCTRRGKRLTIRADDPALRRAQWWERLLFRHRFPAVPTGG